MLRGLQEQMRVGNSSLVLETLCGRQSGGMGQIVLVIELNRATKKDKGDHGEAQPLYCSARKRARLVDLEEDCFVDREVVGANV